LDSFHIAQEVGLVVIRGLVAA